MEAMRAVVLVTCVISILSGVLDALNPTPDLTGICRTVCCQCLYWEF